MAGDDMPAQFIAQLQRALEIKAAAFSHMPGAVRRTVSAEASTANQPLPSACDTLVDNSEADAGAGDRRAEGHMVSTS
jgi:hypothetical protein